MTTAFPLPTGDSELVAAAPGRGDGYWAGAPGVVPHPDGGWVLGYRVRNGHHGVDELVVARTDDGVGLRTLVRLPADRFTGARWTERPAIVRRDDGWTLYACLGGPSTKRWWIVRLDAPTLEELEAAEPVPALEHPDPLIAVKDPIVELRDGVWHAWICCHLLDRSGEEDRMRSDYATSADGADWTWHGTVLGAREGTWRARGARITAVLPDGRAAYDGRASADENWFERIGTADPVDAADPAAGYRDDGEPLFDARYLTVQPRPEGGWRLWYEARLDDLTHELRTEVVA